MLREFFMGTGRINHNSIGIIKYDFENRDQNSNEGRE